MSGPEQPNEPLAPDDAKFVGALRTHFDPPEMNAERRLSFTSELDARIARRRRNRRLVPALVGTLAAAAVAVVAVRFWSITPDSTPLETSEPSAVPIALQEDVEWADDLLFSAAATGPSAADSEEEEASNEFEAELPSDYAAIGSLFLDG